MFDAFLHQPGQTALWHFAFVSITVLIVARGINSGIEKAMNVLMPGLFLMLIGLVGYALSTAGAGVALRYLFVPDFTSLTPGVVLAAVGQAFFSVNVGIGIVLTYSAYLPAPCQSAALGADHLHGRHLGGPAGGAGDLPDRVYQRS